MALTSTFSHFYYDFILIKGFYKRNQVAFFDGGIQKSALSYDKSALFHYMW